MFGPQALTTSAARTLALRRTNSMPVFGTDHDVAANALPLALADGRGFPAGSDSSSASSGSPLMGRKATGHRSVVDAGGAFESVRAPSGAARPDEVKKSNWKKLIDFFVKTKRTQVTTFTFVLVTGALFVTFFMISGMAAGAALPIVMGTTPVIATLAIMFSVFIAVGLIPSIIVGVDRLKDAITKDYSQAEITEGVRRRAITNAALGLASALGYTVNAGLSLASVFLPFMAPVTIGIVIGGIIGAGCETAIRLRTLPPLETMDPNKPWLTEFMTKKFVPVSKQVLAIGIPLVACTVLSLTNISLAAHSLTGGVAGAAALLPGAQQGSGFLTFLSEHMSFALPTVTFIVTGGCDLFIKLCAFAPWAISDMASMYAAAKPAALVEEPIVPAEAHVPAPRPRVAGLASDVADAAVAAPTPLPIGGSVPAGAAA